MDMIKKNEWLDALHYLIDNTVMIHLKNDVDRFHKGDIIYIEEADFNPQYEVISFIKVIGANGKTTGHYIDLEDLQALLAEGKVIK